LETDAAQAVDDKIRELGLDLDLNFPKKPSVSAVTQRQENSLKEA
jgi:hypothetical protein